MQEIILKNKISETKLEALLFFLKSWDIDAEVKTNPNTIAKKKKPSDFFGTMSKEEGEKMQAFVTQSRNEWDRSI